MHRIVAVLGVLALVAFPIGGARGEVAGTEGRIVSVGTMTVARAAHTATALSDGRVLIAGGCTRDGCELGEDGATAELFDPATGAFTDAGAMTTARVGHTATTLPDGRVLIAGGWDRAGVLAGTEVYDPATGTFATGPTMGSRRGGFTATPLADGRVLIVGGFDGSRRLATAELYDPRSAAFVPTGELGTPRGEHAAAPLADGRILVVGGSRDEDDVLASAELYDPVTGTFAPTGAMTVVRRKHAAVPLAGGRVLVVGGADARDGRGQYASAELFDPVTGAFAATGAMSTARFKLPAAVIRLPTGEVLVAGGGDHAELYDPATERFRLVAGDLGAARAFATATLLPDGGVLIAGGYDPTIRPTAGAWVFRPDA